MAPVRRKCINTQCDMVSNADLRGGERNRSAGLPIGDLNIADERWNKQLCVFELMSAARLNAGRLSGAGVEAIFFGDARA
jgi:hypothetical protein